MRIDDEEYLTRSWTDWSRLAERDFRKGFEDGLACNTHAWNASDAYKSGYGDGYWLAQCRDAASLAGEVGVTYEEMAKGA